MQTNVTLNFLRYVLLCMKDQRKNLSPWITKGIKKSSKRKQKLYEKFLKKRNAFNETAYKVYIEAIKRKSKKNHYSQKILQFKYDIKKR